MALCSLLGIECELAAAFILGFILDAFPDASDVYQERISSLLENDMTTVLLVIVVAPLLEELIFRFLILSILRGFLPFFAANLIQAAVFGIYHMNLVQGIYAFLFGLFMGYLIKRTGSVISCISFHLMFNLTGLLLDDFVPYVPGAAIRLIILAISLTGFVFTMMKLVKSAKTGQDRA